MAEPAVDYTRARAILETGSLEDRVALAARSSTLPEILYFLTNDPEPAVRRAVAENPATPPQADGKLSRDSDVSVRCALARKAVGEGLGETERHDLWRMGFTILETLARDKVVRVRRILAEAFSAPPNAPRGIVVGLARDRAREVASPVLRNSPVLDDGDLVEILGEGAPDWAQEAMAGRVRVSPALGEALAVAASVPGVKRLIENPKADIAERTMERIVDGAGAVAEWQGPLVARPSLSQGILRRLATVVAAPLLGILRGRGDLDAETVAGIDHEIATRGTGKSARAAKTRRAEKGIPLARRDAIAPRQETPGERALRMHRAGELTDNALSVALDNKDSGFVMEALALRAGLPFPRVRRMVTVKNGRTMMALAWKAGLSARFGMELQRTLAHIAPPFIVNARDGLDFPFTPAEMNEQLALFDD
jgi:uncharacterized protein (DUF2336 family)